LSGIDTSGESQSTVFDALSGLGFSAKEIREILPTLPSGNPSDQIKHALKLLQSK
jgi:Holliday junction resolvasome RuvABC DNA-binding subunit